MTHAGVEEKILMGSRTQEESNMQLIRTEREETDTRLIPYTLFDGYGVFLLLPVHIYRLIASNLAIG